MSRLHNGGIAYDVVVMRCSNGTEQLVAQVLLDAEAPRGGRGMSHDGGHGPHLAALEADGAKVELKPLGQMPPQLLQVRESRQRHAGRIRPLRRQCRVGIAAQ